jgi:DNA-binding transcriptional MocR family regulator
LIRLDGQRAAWPPEAVELWRSSFRAAASDVGDAGYRPEPAIGDPLLRATVREVLDLDTDDLLITSGVRASCRAIAALHPRAFVERPTFLGVPEALELAGCDVELLEWEELVAGDGAAAGALVWITSPTRNPDGADLLADYAELLGEREGDVVQNEVNRWFTADVRRVDGATVVGSLHKLAGPGSQIGWVAGPLAPRLNLDLLASPPGLWQRSWARFIRSGGLEILRERLAVAVDARRRFEAISGLGGGNGPFLFRRLHGATSEEGAVAALASRGVSVGPGSAFGSATPALRFCFTGVEVHEAERAAEIVHDTIGDAFVPAADVAGAVSRREPRGGDESLRRARPRREAS